MKERPFVMLLASGCMTLAFWFGTVVASWDCPVIKSSPIIQPESLLLRAPIYRAAYPFAYLDAATAARAKRAERFIITFPRTFYSGEPIEIKANDRLDAITSLRITVWTEKEWNDACQLMAKQRPAYQCPKPQRLWPDEEYKP